MELTTEIYGADAKRLADCINFAAKNNLTITKHTQVGVNENSGNVWLWDEDWTGCIYQNIQNQGPFISWTCPNCGEEFDCKTMIESDERTNWSYDHDDKCETCVGN